MSKQESTTKKKRDSKSGPSTNPQAPDGKKPKENGEPKEDLVVFAFRLTAAERELLHEAAGPAKASRFVRTLAVAAARGDKARIEQILDAGDPAIN